MQNMPGSYKPREEIRQTSKKCGHSNISFNSSTVEAVGHKYELLRIRLDLDNLRLRRLPLTLGVLLLGCDGDCGSGTCA